MDSFATNITIIVIAAVLIIFITVIVIRRVQLELWIFKTYYGKFSYKYVSLFRKYFNKNPYPHSVKYEISHFLHLLNKTNREELLTDKDIIFQGLEPGISYPNFHKQKGNPDYFTIQEFEEIKIFVWGYNYNMYDYDTTVLYFFIDNIFIMGQYNFRKENQNINITDLSSKIKSKYFENNETIKLKEIVIKDSKGSKIQLFDDGFSIRISIYNPGIPIVKEKLLNNINISKQQYLHIKSGSKSEELTF